MFNRFLKNSLPTAVTVAAVLGASNADAGPTIEFDENKSITICAGARASFSATEDIAGINGDKYAKDFNLDRLCCINIRRDKLRLKRCILQTA